MQEIYKNAPDSTNLATDCRGHDGTSWTPSSHMMNMTDRHRHNGPSRISVPKHLNSWNLGTGTTSLNFMTNQQDRPSWIRRSVTHSVTPHLVRLPHLPSAAALRCHLRTFTSTTNHHKLRRWYFSVFLAKKPPHSSFR